MVMKVRFQRIDPAVELELSDSREIPEGDKEFPFFVVEKDALSIIDLYDPEEIRIPQLAHSPETNSSAEFLFNDQENDPFQVIDGNNSLGGLH